MSFVLRLDPKKRAAGRFIGRVRDELVRAFLDAKADHGVTQASLAQELGVHRSRITRALKGEENLTLRSVAEIATALDREIVFSLRRPSVKSGQNAHNITKRSTINSPADWPSRHVAKVDQAVREAAI